LLNIDLELINKDKYTFASFISPSGNGFKVLVKIPAEIENHKLYFDSISEYYNNPHFDITSKNISRICFESYDPIQHDPQIYSLLNRTRLWLQKQESVDIQLCAKGWQLPPTDTLILLSEFNEITQKTVLTNSKHSPTAMPTGGSRPTSLRRLPRRIEPRVGSSTETFAASGAASGGQHQCTCSCGIRGPSLSLTK
jgi:hypothetical protein